MGIFGVTLLNFFKDIQNALCLRHLTWLFFGASLPFPSSCGLEREEHVGSNFQSPISLPRPADFTPYLACPTKHRMSSRSWLDPVSGEFISKRYASANEINYFRDQWEERAPASWSYLSEAHTGESAENLRIVWIDIRTVEGVPFFHYYGNASRGISTHLNPVEPWSSSKVYGVAMAFHRLRYESGGQIGGTASIDGKISIGHDLDYLNDVSSNKRGGFYKALAGRKLATDMIRNWIRRPNETFGGFYGDSTFSVDQEFEFRSPEGVSQSFFLRNDVFTPNSLSPLTLAEMIKRLGVGFKDPDSLPKMVDYSANPAESELRQALPSLLPEDLQTLFYGSNSGGVGGMMFDGLRDIPNNIGGADFLNWKTEGRWRVFGKGGSGYSASRLKSEESTGDWVCLPGVAGEGLEFALYAHIDGPNKLARLHAVIGRVARALYPELFL